MFPSTSLLLKYLRRVIRKINAPDGECQKSLRGTQSKLFPPADVDLIITKSL